MRINKGHRLPDLTPGTMWKHRRSHGLVVIARQQASSLFFMDAVAILNGTVGVSTQERELSVIEFLREYRPEDSATRLDARRVKIIVAAGRLARSPKR